MIDEKVTPEFPITFRTGVRTLVLNSLNLNPLGFTSKSSPITRVSNLAFMLRYAMQYGMCPRKKLRPMTNQQLDELVTAWTTAILGMCSAHTKDEYDHHDAQADTLLTPILTAPVKQVREFYHKLQTSLNTNPKVPMLVWMAFDAWGEVLVKNAPDEGIKRLKHKLAQEITDLVEGDIRDQIPEAIKRALKWRDEATLQEVKEVLTENKAAIAAGKTSKVKPKLVGRQSCLFLELKVPANKKKKQAAKNVSVML